MTTAAQDDTQQAKAKFLESVETGKANLSKGLLSQLDHNEMEKMLIFLSEDRDSAQINMIQEEIKSRSRMRVRLATMGERVWTYFYDKYILRILLVAWLVLSNILLKPAIPGNVQMTPAQSVPAFNLVLIAGVIVVIIGWRFWLAVRESKQGFGSVSRAKLYLRITCKDGRPPSLMKSIMRGFFKTFPVQFLTLLSMEGAKFNRGFHDRIAGTYVLRLSEADISAEEIASYIASIEAED